MNKLFLLILILLFLSRILLAQDVSFEITHTCSDNNNGIITAIILSEDFQSPYSFIWTDEDGFFLPSTYEDTDSYSTIANLAAGFYCLSVISNPAGCIASSCSLEVQDIGLNISALNSTCICPGGSGSIDIEIISGSGDYSFFWDGPALVNPLVQNVEVAAPGDYSVTVVDNQTNCEVTAEVTVGECVFDFSNFNTTINPACTNTNSGSITIQIPQGAAQAPYIFSWYLPGENPANAFETYNSTDGNGYINNLAGGEYCVQILSNNGCIAEQCGLVVQSFESPAINYVVTPASTSGANDGSIDLQLFGGTEPFTFEWDDPNGTSTEDLSNVSPGIYCVLVTYGDGCTIEECINLHDCDELLSTIDLEADIYAATPPNLASIDLTVTDLVGYNFIYNWDNGETTEDISGLEPGESYCVTVSSSTTCVLEEYDCFMVCEFSILMDIYDYDCEGASVSAIVDAPGPKTFQWDNGVNSSTIFALFDVPYCVTVSALGCEAKACVTAQHIPVQISTVITNSTYGMTNGAINLNVQGGIPSYSYSWAHDPDETSESISGLKPGTYCVTVTDDCGLEATVCPVVECEFGPKHFYLDRTPVHCDPLTSGAIDIIPSVPHNPNLEYIWNTGATTEDLTGVYAGIYSVTITDPNTGCYAEMNNIEVSAEGEGNFDVLVQTNPGCTGSSSGLIHAFPAGGIAPYSYQWFQADDINGWTLMSSKLSTIQNLSEGYYSVVITDLTGCSSSQDVFLWGNPLFYLDVQTSLCFENQETVELEILPGFSGSSGIPPYTLTFSNQNVIPNFTFSVPYEETIGGLDPGTWTITLTDSDGCQATSWFSNDNLIPIEVDAEVGSLCIFSTGVPPNPTSIQIENVSNGNPPYTYQWCCGATQTSTGLTNITVEGTYFLTLTDALGCTLKKEFEVREISLIGPVTGTVTNANCTCCETGGAIHLLVENVTPPYYLLHYEETSAGVVPVEFLGEFWETEVTISDLTVGVEHFFNISSAPEFPACISLFFDPFIILPTNPIEISLTGSQNQSGGNLGSINVTVAGGTQPYSYLWSNGATTQNISNIPGGTYFVTVTDASGCAEVGEFSICSNPIAFNYSLPETYPVDYVTTCSEFEGGKLIVPEPGEGIGNPPFSYSWNGPNGFSAEGAKIENLYVEGPYCVTITDACGLTATYCQELKCNCFIGHNSSIDDCTDEDPGHITVNYIYPFKNHEYFILWGNGDIAKVFVNAENEVQDVIFGTKHKSFPEGVQGLFCYSIVDAEWGCQNEQCILFTNDPTASTKVFEVPYDSPFSGESDGDDKNVIEKLEELGFPYDLPNQYIMRWGNGHICESEWDDWNSGRLKYQPYSNIEPCKAGGLIYTGEGSSGQIEVYPNFSGFEFNVGGQCFCLWPPGMFTNDSWFISIADGTIASQNYPQSPFSNFHIPDNPYNSALIAEVDCEPDVNIPPGGIPPVTTGPNCDDIEGDPCGSEDCIFVSNAENCTWEVYCESQLPLEPGDEPVEGGILPAWSYCFYEEAFPGTECGIIEYCPFESCNEDNYLPLVIENNTIGDPYWSVAVIVDLIQEYPALEEYLNPLILEGSPCPNGWCSCSILSNYFPPCPDCDYNFVETAPIRHNKELNKLSNYSTLQSEIDRQKSAYGNTFSVKLSPNPFTTKLNIEIESKIYVKAGFQIFNMLGERIWSDQFVLNEGVNSIQWVPVDKLATGVYYLHIWDENGNFFIGKIVNTQP